jgi:hypothetical protein
VRRRPSHQTLPSKRDPGTRRDDQGGPQPGDNEGPRRKRKTESPARLLLRSWCSTLLRCDEPLLRFFFQERTTAFARRRSGGLDTLKLEGRTMLSRFAKCEPARLFRIWRGSDTFVLPRQTFCHRSPSSSTMKTVRLAGDEGERRARCGRFVPLRLWRASDAFPTGHIVVEEESHVSHL